MATPATKPRPPLTVSINGARGDEWERAVGTRTFPVTTWNPMRGNLPGKPNAEIWMINLGALEPELLDKIVLHLAQKFEIPADEMRHEVLARGIPVLADDAFVVLHDPQRWL